jgi:hypothetical protein
VLLFLIRTLIYEIFNAQLLLEILLSYSTVGAACISDVYLMGNKASSGSYDPGFSPQDSELSSKELLEKPITETHVSDPKTAHLYNETVKNTASYLTIAAQGGLYGKAFGLGTKASVKLGGALMGSEFTKDTIHDRFNKVDVGDKSEEENKKNEE